MYLPSHKKQFSFHVLLIFLVGLSCCFTINFSSRIISSITSSTSNNHDDKQSSLLLQRKQSEQHMHFKVDNEASCPKSLSINTKNDHVPYTEIMTLQDIHAFLKYWYELNCPLHKSCTFTSIGQHLLHHAMNRNQTLLTVQVGAMDGQSNDPMHAMFVNQKHIHVNGRDEPFSDLRNWLPVLIEPVPTNYEAMLQTYGNIATEKGLACAVPIHAAVSYDSSNVEKTCPFCRVNTADDAPARCKEIPDWMSLQIGTLDCDYSQKFFGKDFDLCVLQDPLPCDSIANLLNERSIPVESIAMLQIDIEAYEYILLEGFMNDVGEEHKLPPIIHFEQKVMIAMDRKYPLEKEQEQEQEGERKKLRTRMSIVEEMLTSKGYVFVDEGEDILALKMNHDDGSSM